MNHKMNERVEKEINVLSKILKSDETISCLEEQFASLIEMMREDFPRLIEKGNYQEKAR